MKGVINNHPVEQDHVLDRRTATNIQLPALVPSKNNTGQNLKVLRQVGGATIQGVTKAGDKWSARRGG